MRVSTIHSLLLLHSLSQLSLQTLLQFLKFRRNLHIYLLIHATIKDKIVYITANIKNIVLEKITANNSNIENTIDATSMGQFNNFSSAIDTVIITSGIAKNINNTFIIHFSPFIVLFEATFPNFIYIMNVNLFCY